VFCHKCGATLYESIEELKSPDEIIQSYDGKCPTCGKKLAYIPINFEIKSILETNQLSPFEPEKRRPSRRKSRSNTKKRERKRNGHASYEPMSGSMEELNKRTRKKESV